MKKLLLSGTVAAAFFATMPAIAQPAPPPPPGVAPGTAPAPQVQTFIQRMPMKAETRNDVVAHVREMFAKLDTNRDGFVTREEADSMHQAMAGDMHEKFAQRLAGHDMPKIDRGAMFDKLDANKDGMISRQEFMAAQPQVQERRVIVMRDGPDGGDGPVEIDGGPGEPHMKIMRMHGMGMKMHGRMFESADANHDGKVSLQEMTDAALHHFDEADANHDGTLTPEERMQMHHQKKAQRMQPA